MESLESPRKSWKVLEIFFDLVRPGKSWIFFDSDRPIDNYLYGIDIYLVVIKELNMTKQTYFQKTWLEKPVKDWLSEVLQISCH